jgi:DNA modification methylase
VNYELIKGDCIEHMEAMKPETFDLTVTSPPYDNLRTYEGSLQWNEEIWKQVLEQLYRVTKQGGVVVWVVGDATVKGSETGTSFKQALYAKEVGFNLHDTMIYQKYGSGMPHKTHRYGQTFEFMFVLAKGTPSHGTIKTYPKTGEIGKTTRRQADGTIKRGTYNIGGGKLPNIWQYAGETKQKHPAPFPEALASDHIKSWSNEGDVVFDPFMGSGTTGKMALHLNRKFVGVEKVDEYYAIAKERLVTARSRQLELEVME